MRLIARLYERNHLGDIIKVEVKDIFVSMTVGGGIHMVAPTYRKLPKTLVACGW